MAQIAQMGEVWRSVFLIRVLSAICGLLLSVLPDSARAAVEQPPQTGPTVPGNKASVSGGRCIPPANAPLAVKKAIWATNYLVGRPYVWGGGHGTFYDRGYDCSGSVSFLLHHAGALAQPTTSRGLQSYGEPGPGHWVTIYARAGHTFAIVCGVRLDTTGGTGRDEGPSGASMTAGRGDSSRDTRRACSRGIE